MPAEGVRHARPIRAAPAMDRGAGDAGLLQCAAREQVGLLDETDDLELPGSGVHRVRLKQRFGAVGNRGADR